VIAPASPSASSAAPTPALRVTSRPLTICVLGGSGFLGTELVLRLVRVGHTVRVPTRNLQHVDHLLVLSSVQVLAGDPHSATFLERAVSGCDVVINLIGILNESGRPDSFRQVHVELMRRLLQAMAGRVHRLLHVSAVGADKAKGASEYLRSKGEAEELIRASNTDWTLLRPTVIFGPGDSLVNRFAHLLRLSRGWLPLARAGTRFAPVYVGDVAEALRRCLPGEAARHRIGNTGSQTYELGGRDTVTLADIVRVSAQASGLPCHLIALPDSLGRLQARVAGCLPGKPFSMDNFNSLSRDSIPAEDGCARLGIQPVEFGVTVADLLRPLSRPHPAPAYHYGSVAPRG
jgi:NADH dehydrogenase